MQNQKIQNLLLVLRSYLASIKRGAAKQKAPNPKTFAVVNLTANVGDMVCTTPVLRAIKKSNPNARVVVVGIPRNGITLANSGLVDRYIDSKRPYADIIKDLTEEQPDFGCAINPSVVEASLLFLSDTRQIVGFDIANEHSAESRAYRVLKRLITTVPYSPGQYVPREYLRLLLPAGIESEDTTKTLGYSPEAGQWLEGLLKEHAIDASRENLFAVSPGAGTKIKQWPAKRFASLADYAWNHYRMPAVLIGGPGDKEEEKAFLEAVGKDTKVINTVGVPIEELKATLSRCAVILANDSGPVYFAEAFGVATMVVVGPTDELEHPPKGPQNRIVLPPERGKALLQSMVSSEDGINQEEARRQIESITVERVIDEFDDLMATLQIPKQGI